jgi:hypothetical protein
MMDVGVVRVGMCKPRMSVPVSYFENEVLRKRAYLTKEMCVRVGQAPIRIEPQENNRFRFWTLRSSAAATCEG